MTLKELLLQCEFDKVVEYIKKSYESQTEMLPYYKEVFDRLRHTEPEPCKAKIHISMVYPKKIEGDPYVEDPYVDVCGIHQRNAGQTLDCELQIDLEASLDELAAHCLWEYTYYGFSDEEMEEYFSRWRSSGHSQYALLAEQIQLEHYKKLIYSKRKRDFWQDYKNFGGKAFSKDIWREIKLHTQRCNRSRRKRNYRQEQRIAKLERKDKVDWLIQRLTMNPASTPFLRKELTFLFSTTQIREIDYHSYAYDVKNRVAYIREQIEKYSSFDFHGYEQYLVLVSTSPEYPLSSEESFAFIADQFPKEATVQWGYNYNETLGQEVKILIVMCK